MAKSSSHNPSSPEITPKKEPATLDKPKSPNPFLPADQVEFIFEEIAFTANNEVALLYPSHTNSEYFREVTVGRLKAKATLKKSCLPPRWRLTGWTSHLVFSSFICTLSLYLGHDVSVDFTENLFPGLSAPNDSIPSQQRIDEGPKDIKLITYLLLMSPELSKLLASHNFASCLPTKLKKLPSKFTELSGEIKELKQHVKDMEIELPGDFKEIPTKLEILLSNVLTVLHPRFTNVVENVSGAITKDVPSAGQATASPAEGEKNTTKDAEINLQNDLVDSFRH
ncbi:hypothetical protein Tco_0710535 [Tanacetum coccineum]